MTRDDSDRCADIMKLRVTLTARREGGGFAFYQGSQCLGWTMARKNVGIGFLTEEAKWQCERLGWELDRLEVVR